MTLSRVVTRWIMSTHQAILEKSSREPTSAQRTGRRREVTFPMLLTVDDAADLLRTRPRAIYAMVERRQLPGIVHIGRRVLIRGDELLDWLEQKSASSRRSEER